MKKIREVQSRLHYIQYMRCDSERVYFPSISSEQRNKNNATFLLYAIGNAHSLHFLYTVQLFFLLNSLCSAVGVLASRNIRGYRYADKSKVSLQSCEHLTVTHYSCNTFNEAYARLDFENVM